MKIPGKHKDYLRRKDYQPCCKDIFSRSEFDILQKYGHWMEALSSGVIKPLTTDQERFIRVCKNECEPTTEFETAWCKLVERQKFEAESKSKPHYDNIDPSEKWFPRSEWSGNNSGRYDG